MAIRIIHQVILTVSEDLAEPQKQILFNNKISVYDLVGVWQNPKALHWFKAPIKRLHLPKMFLNSLT